jgi:hypothetical protein
MRQVSVHSFVELRSTITRITICWLGYSDFNLTKDAIPTVRNEFPVEYCVGGGIDFAIV